MEQAQRILLYIGLFVVALLLWNAWKKEFPSVPVQPQQVQQQKAIPSVIPTTDAAKTNLPAIAAPPAAKQATLTTKVPQDRLIQVHTDVLNMSIDTLGGNIVNTSLPKYPEKMNTPDVPFKLLTDNPGHLYISESALVGKNGPDKLKALAQYTSSKKVYTLQPNENTLVVGLHWKNNQGLDITKTFTFTRDSYLVKVGYDIVNKSGQAYQGQMYTQITRKDVKPGNGGLFQIHPYFGAAISSPEERYKKVSFKDMKETPIQQSIKNGWTAMVQRYFVSAWIPNPDETFKYYTKADANEVYTIGMASPTITVAPNATKSVSARFYTGPEITSVLKGIAPGLELTVSYGWLWFISVIIFWVMNKIYLFVGNWGWSIILVTVLIKLMFYHLSAKSYSSMAKMRGLQPKIQAMRERLKDDKQKQSAAMMELYKKEKVNPLGGCLPIVVQIPVFFALYMVLIESVQLRQAPWILWIHDLSMPDPYFILPVIMGITMFIQQKLNPPPPDPTQAKVMMFLPVVFTVLFAYFPAGLVLYWVVNNGLSILQQWWITRKYELSMAARKKK